MRARAYFIDDKKQFVEINQLSPFDVTKIHIYNSIGIIVKSEEFYESFAFKIDLK